MTGIDEYPMATLPTRGRSQLPLYGVKAISCEAMVALPFGTQLLADFGADVIVVEHANFRDDVNSRWRLRTGRHKRRVAINLRDPRGQKMVRQLVARADIFAENYRPGVMDKYGLGFKDLGQLNPRLVYVSMSGFGHSDFLASPLSSAASYGPIAEAMGGVAAMLGSATHTGTETLALGDIMSSLFATIGALIALRDRDRTGAGQYVDVSMADSLLALSERSIVIHTLGQLADLEPDGTRTPPMPSGFGSFDLVARDGRYVLTMLEGARSRQWDEFCRLLGHSEWVDDPGLLNAATARKAFETMVLPVLNEWARTKSKAEVAGIFQAAGVAAAPVLTPAEIVEEPHFAARRMFTNVVDEMGKQVKVVGNPIKLSRIEAEQLQPDGMRIPTPGQDTENVLASELGLSSEEIADLFEAGVIVETGVIAR